MKQLLAPLVDWYLKSLSEGGYFLIALLMAIESSIVPLPSEVIIPPAAHMAWSGEGLHFFGWSFSGWSAQIGIVIARAIGSWVGASFMYWASRWAGRPLITHYGKYVFISEKKIEGAHKWAEHYGSFGIFVSRLLPVVRHLIGIPAGIVEMDFLHYSIYTLLGSALWSAVLCWLGVSVGADISQGNFHQVTHLLGAFVLGVGLLYFFFVHRHMKGAKTPTR